MCSTWQTSRVGKAQGQHGKCFDYIHGMKSLSNILFVRRKIFTCTINEGDDLLHHINKVKLIEDQLMCLEEPVRNKNILTTLLESLTPSYEYLVTALETLLMTKLTREIHDKTFDLGYVEEGE